MSGIEERYLQSLTGRILQLNIEIADRERERAAIVRKIAELESYVTPEGLIVVPVKTKE